MIQSEYAVGDKTSSTMFVKPITLGVSFYSSWNCHCCRDVPKNYQLSRKGQQIFNLDKKYDANSLLLRKILLV